MCSYTSDEAEILYLYSSSDTSGLLHFKNSEFEEKGWHTTMDEKTGNDLFGKKTRKNIAGAWS